MDKIDDKMAMAVLPASYRVSFDLLKKAAGASKVELANGQEFRAMFPVWRVDGVASCEAVEKMVACFDGAQHERKVINDFMVPPVRPERVEG